MHLNESSGNVHGCWREVVINFGKLLRSLGEEGCILWLSAIGDQYRHKSLLQLLALPINSAIRKRKLDSLPSVHSAVQPSAAMIARNPPRTALAYRLILHLSSCKGPLPLLA
jgi:hypothetical protein